MKLGCTLQILEKYSNVKFETKETMERTSQHSSLALNSGRTGATLKEEEEEEEEKNLKKIRPTEFETSMQTDGHDEAFANLRLRLRNVSFDVNSIL